MKRMINRFLNMLRWKFSVKMMIYVLIAVTLIVLFMLKHMFHKPLEPLVDISPPVGLIKPVNYVKPSILKYQKCQYPKVDPFDQATISYHNRPKIFKCNWQRHSFVENEVLRINVTGIKEAWLYYIIRIADSKSALSDALPLYTNGRANDNVEVRLPQKPCFSECGGHGGHCALHCGENGYCCRKGYPDCPVHVARHAPADVYGCTKVKGELLYYRVSQEYFKVKFITTKRKTFEEYQHAFLKPPNTEDNVNDRPNIVMIHLDGASDAAVKRGLQKTYVRLYNDENTIIFNQHSIIGDGTTQNMCGVLTGSLINELPEARKSERNGNVCDKWPFIWKDMHALKYQTWFVEEYGPKGGTFHYRLRGFNKPPVTHYYRPLWMILDPLMRAKPLCSSKFHMENLRQYYTTYKNYNKYSLIMYHYLSHDDSSWVRNADDDILGFYKFLEREGHMNNTVFILYGDHGNRASRFRATFQGKLEERFPFLAITVPPWFNKHKKLMDTIKLNKDVLTTHFDTYSTLQHILTFPHANSKTKTKHGVSLFRTDLRKLNRTCKDVSIRPHYCLCLSFQSVSTQDSGATAAVEHVIKYMNQETEKFASGYCAELSLKTFITASREIGLRGITNYQVKFTVWPSNGLFEASVTCDRSSGWTKTCGSPEISRTNRYWSQPECIRDIAPRLAKYCYCKTYKGKISEV